MTFIPNWEEFEKSAEMLYLRDPLNTRYSMKYSHSKGAFLVKITDNKKGQCYSIERSRVLNYNNLNRNCQTKNDVLLQKPASIATYKTTRLGKVYERTQGGFLAMNVLMLSTVAIRYIGVAKCLQYKTEVQQDVRKIDKFISNLMRHMASNDK